MKQEAQDLLATLTNDRIRGMPSADLRKAFVVLHESYRDVEVDRDDLKDERNAVAMELAGRGESVAGGYRIVLTTRVEVEDGYEDSDSREIEELDREIAALKRRRDALAKNQRERAGAVGRTRETVTVLVREVA